MLRRVSDEAALMETLIEGLRDSMSIPPPP
jgi:hypothetical protein